MVTISLCMIVKNEEEVLSRCLDSIQGIAEEIIIVDTGSVDNTVKIARKYTEHVLFFPWQDDFSAARNASFDAAHMDYCMWLDADDVLEGENREKLIQLKTSLSPDTDIVMLPYHGGFDDSGRPTLTYYRERLIRREKNFRWEGMVHECITPRGKIVYGDAAISHRKNRPSDGDRNLRIYQKKITSGEMLCPRDQFYYGRELMYHGFWQEASETLKKFVDSGKGWGENCIEALRNMAWCQKQAGQRKKALQALLQALEFGAPRAELCCDLGDWFREEKRYETAVFWYQCAAGQKMQPQTGGFVVPDCYGYLPWLQMSLCWYYLGNLKQAAYCNEKALAFHPGDSICIRNQNFYNNAMENERQGREV